MVKKEAIKIGDQVFVIKKDLTIEEKEVLAIITTEDKLGYTLDKNSCGGYSEDDVFSTKAKADVVVHEFMDNIKFKEGDLIIFEHKEYSRKEKAIGRIVGINHSDLPYEIRGSCKEFESICEEQILLRIKNKFIENFGNIKELYQEFEDKKREVSNIMKSIQWEFDKLETEVHDSVRKQYGLFNWNKSKPLFKDRFTYQEDRNYYD